MLLRLRVAAAAFLAVLAELELGWQHAPSAGCCRWTRPAQRRAREAGAVICDGRCRCIPQHKLPCRVRPPGSSCDMIQHFMQAIGDHALSAQDWT